MIAIMSALGYDGSITDWEHDFSRYVGPDGVDMSHVYFHYQLLQNYKIED